MALKIQIKTGPKQHLSSVRDVLTFGKHSGCSVMDICHDEPEYLTWLHDKEAVTIDRELLEIIWESINNKTDDTDYSDEFQWQDWGDK